MKILKTYESFINKDTDSINESIISKIKDAYNSVSKYFTGKKISDIPKLFSFLKKEKSWLYNLIYLDKIGELKRLRISFDRSSMDPEELAEIENEINLAINYVGTKLTGYSIKEDKKYIRPKSYDEPEHLDPDVDFGGPLSDEYDEKEDDYGSAREYGKADPSKGVRNVTHKELEEIIALDYDKKQRTQKPSTLFIWGFSGFGKTKTVEKVCKNKGLLCLSWLLSKCSPEEIRGALVPDMPDPENPDKKLHSKWYIPEIFPPSDDTKTKGILFFDEVNRAHQQTINAVLKLLLSHQMDNYKLPSQWGIVCAGNWSNEGEGKDIEGMDQNVNDLDIAARTRLRHYNLYTTSTSYLSYAEEKQFPPEILKFLTFYKEFLHKTPEKGTDPKTFPNPRNWEKFADGLRELRKKKDRPESIEIGREASPYLTTAVRDLFLDFMRVDKQYSDEELINIFTNPSKAPKIHAKDKKELEAIFKIAIAARPDEMVRQNINELVKKDENDYTPADKKLNKYIENFASFYKEHANDDPAILSIIREFMGINIVNTMGWVSGTMKEKTKK